jgi:hypothetical protein
MDPIPLCPDWWPHMLWRLHFPIVIGPHVDPPNPVNFPAGMNNIMAHLHVHTLSYLMADQQAAQEIRSASEKQLVNAIQTLSEDHDRAVSG